MPIGAPFSTGTFGFRFCSRYFLQALSPPEKVASTSTFSNTAFPMSKESAETVGGGGGGSDVCENGFTEINTNKKNKAAFIIIMAEVSFSHYKNRNLNLVFILRQLQMLPVVFCRL